MTGSEWRTRSGIELDAFYDAVAPSLVAVAKR